MKYEARTNAAADALFVFLASSPRFDVPDVARALARVSPPTDADGIVTILTTATRAVREVDQRVQGHRRLRWHGWDRGEDESAGDEDEVHPTPAPPFRIELDVGRTTAILIYRPGAAPIFRIQLEGRIRAGELTEADFEQHERLVAFRDEAAKRGLVVEAV